MTRIALAYSGGLDTSFCTAWLTRERGAEVVTVCVDTGGFTAADLEALERRALAAGAVQHITVDGRARVMDRFVDYVVKGHVLRGQVYPVSVAAERTAQTEAVVEAARQVGATALAHGSTGAGNDQVRFDVATAVLAPELEVLAPVRELGWSRQQEADWLAEHGFAVAAETVEYSVNAGLVGTTVGGVETHDGWSLPPESVYTMTVEPSAAPAAGDTVVIGFEQGRAVSLDGQRLPGHELLAALNQRGGAQGFGRGIHVGDTILGVKGRIAFEAPGSLALVLAHRELAKLVQTRWQAHWCEQLGAFWGEQLHQGLFHDPACRDAEALLDHANRLVTGEVRLHLCQGRAEVQGARSPHSLLALQDATYGETSSAWSGAEAAGFARLHGLQAVLAARQADAAGGAPGDPFAAGSAAPAGSGVAGEAPAGTQPAGAAPATGTTAGPGATATPLDGPAADPDHPATHTTPPGSASGQHEGSAS